MSLLREIQRDATSVEVPLGTVLRRCLVLARPLKHEPLGEWASRELNGYPAGAVLPEYRVFRVNLKGHFFGPLQSGMKNVDIPRWVIPDEFTDDVTTHRSREPVAQLEQLASSGQTLQLQLPAELAALIDGNLIEGYTCLQVFAPLPSAALAAILDSVRTRVLEFALALEIEEVNPDAGEAEGVEPPVAIDRVHQIFNTTINNSQNVAIGGSDFEQTAHVHHGDLDSLVAALHALGLGETWTDELRTAIATDASGGMGVIGAATQSWMKRAMGAAKSGALALTGGVAADAIADLVLAYFGIG